MPAVPAAIPSATTIDLAAANPALDRVPVVDVGAVDRGGMDAGTLRHVDLVPHEREQRRDQERRPRAAITQQPRRDEVHRTLAPTGALHDEGATTVVDQGLDSLPLLGTEGAGGASGETTE